jgi:hypothetical protein
MRSKSESSPRNVPASKTPREKGGQQIDPCDVRLVYARDRNIPGVFERPDV